MLFSPGLISRNGDINWPPKLNNKRLLDYFLWFLFKVKSMLKIQQHLHSSKSMNFKLLYMSESLIKLLATCNCAQCKHLNYTKFA